MSFLNTDVQEPSPQLASLAVEELAVLFAPRQEKLSSNLRSCFLLKFKKKNNKRFCLLSAKHGTNLSFACFTFNMPSRSHLNRPQFLRKTLMDREDDSFSPSKEDGEERAASRAFLRAVLVRQPVEGDGPLATRTLEEALDGVVPAQLVLLLHTAVGRFEVGVVALGAKSSRVVWFNLSLRYGL